MKCLFTLLTFLLFFNLGYSQDYRLWTDEALTVGAAATLDSDYFNLTDDYRALGKFNGLMAVVLDVDSSTTVCGDDDSLYFVPMYEIMGTWFSGDTIQWDRINTADYGVDDTFLDLNIEAIVTETHTDSLFVWVVDPTSVTNIEGYPIWENFGLRVLHNDSVNTVISATLGRH